MKGGVEVAIPNRNSVEGDIIEKLKEGDTVKEESYKVRIRGSQSSTSTSQKGDGDGDGDKVMIVKKSDLIQILNNPKELLRDGLNKAKKRNPSRQDLKTRWLALCIDDEIGYLINCHTNPKTLDGMPKNIENQVLARIVASYYLGYGMMSSSGRTLTSYVKALSPFMKVVDRGDDGIANVGSLCCGTSGSIVEGFKSLITRDPSRAGALLVRAFAFCLYRMDNWQEGNGDSLLDAFCIAISAIHLIDGNELPGFDNSHSTILSSIDSFFHQHGIDLYEKLRCNGIPSACAPGAKLNSNHLIWCLCMNLLSMYRVVKDHFLSSNKESEYERLLPIPFGTTTNEVQRVMNLAIKYRRQSPATYLKVYTAIMHEYDIMNSEDPLGTLRNAHQMIQIGGKFAQWSADPFYLYNFEMLRLLWTPTNFTDKNDMMSFNQVKEKIKKTHMQWKQPCLEYIPEFMFLNSENCIVSLKGYAKYFIDQGYPADNLIPCCPNIQLYFVGRFGGKDNKYFGPGGKIDSLNNNYRCSYCSLRLIKVSTCGRCKAAHYCGKDCQKKHWKSRHKRECVPYKKNKK